MGGADERHLPPLSAERTTGASCCESECPRLRVCEERKALEGRLGSFPRGGFASTTSTGGLWGLHCCAALPVAASLKNRPPRPPRSAFLSLF